MGKKKPRRKRYSLCPYCYFPENFQEKIESRGFNGDIVDWTEDGYCKACKRILKKDVELTLFKDDIKVFQLKQKIKVISC